MSITGGVAVTGGLSRSSSIGNMVGMEAKVQGLQKVSYSALDLDEEVDEEVDGTGWKLACANVFRPPQNMPIVCLGWKWIIELYFTHRSYNWWI